MKKLGSEKTRIKSRLILENRERDQILNISYGDDDLFLEIETILKSNNYAIGNNSRYAQLKKAYTNDDRNIGLIAHQEAMQFLQIAKHIASEAAWRDDILKSFTNDPAVPRKESKHTPGKDKQFELYLAARFKQANISVAREEPDLLCNIEGYEFTVAAKRIKEAGKQIMKAGKPVIIAVDISPLQTMYHAPY